eukprot:CAMPEP_0183711656 /NCGR_PEP_ID=MMETSP0737-20130205/7117_1 /TAXON_ID=385413 /ORGANISM="Thalassiosira miniscula, Strain CCMP1093" /LENGTH=942 /DNA_ID=CAMNT_0025940223 /DNA_START=236 /DNA_END=3064 /DNA_ORIENTATION=-
MALLHQAALTLLIASGTLVTSVDAQGSIFVCGSKYDDASLNCTVNPKCPTGAGCPADKNICFAMPEDQCFSPASPAPTSSINPTNSPTVSPMKVCGSNFNDALTNCRTNAQCPSGGGCGFGKACFDVPQRDCPTLVPTKAPTPTPKVCGVDGWDAQAKCPDMSKHCPSGDGCGIGEACWSVPKDLCGVTQPPTPGPTESPTREPLPQVCGTSAAEAQANCLDMTKRCPNNVECGFGEACFTVPKAVCGVQQQQQQQQSPNDVDSISPGAEAMAASLEPTPSPTSEYLYVCGDGYTDALTNCRTNQECPTGDGCATGGCYALPRPSCPKEVPDTADLGLTASLPMNTPNPTPEPTTEPTPTPTPEPTPDPTSEPTSEPTRGPTRSSSSSPTLSPATNSPTASPTHGPTIVIVPTVPTPSPIPQNVYVCGESYNDAVVNQCSNDQCPTGEGCPTGGCYVLPYKDCSVGEEDTSTTTTTSTATPGAINIGNANVKFNDTVEPTVEPSISPYPSASPSTKPSLMPSYPPTERPTGSPVYNIYFCGKTWELAEENCWTAERCPSGWGCSNPDETCYPINAQRCLSPAPTDSPTGPGPRPSASPTSSSAPSDSPSASKEPTFSPTARPTDAPVVNTNFCGSLNNYNDAFEKCSERTACPDYNCPNGMTCYTGITCPAMMQSQSNPNFILGPPPTTPPPTPKPTWFNNPSPSWTEDIGLTTAPALSPTNMNFCGFNLQDAEDRCAETTPCPDGKSLNVCEGSQTCFRIFRPCGFSPPADVSTLGGSQEGSQGSSQEIGQDSNTIMSISQPITTPPALMTPPPSTSPTNKPVIAFNPSATRFCGSDYFDALNYCYERMPCAAASDVCPVGQTCFGVPNCETPPPTLSMVPTNFVASEGRTASPTQKPTAKPTSGWDFTFETASNGSLRAMSGLIVQALAMGGVIWGWLLL